mmetsp:Transcript_89198/g.158111  ORF Transcript_89198/g.158111 Transcript_89198/m.158111 type:complete len:339 (-) Transcript_89198:31-1047(-)
MVKMKAATTKAVKAGGAKATRKSSKLSKVAPRTGKRTPGRASCPRPVSGKRTSSAGKKAKISRAGKRTASALKKSRATSALKKGRKQMKPKKVIKAMKSTKVSMHERRCAPKASSSRASLGRACKTKQCSFWREGKCRRGDACGFAHGAEQNEHCKMILCRFHTAANFPDRCKYAHSEEELQVAAGKAKKEHEPTFRSMAGKAEKTLQCSFWMNGTCSRVDCKFAHGEEEQRRACKLVLCQFEVAGHCRQGADCWYAHAEDEKQASAEKLGLQTPPPRYTGSSLPGLGLRAPPGLEAPPGLVLEDKTQNFMLIPPFPCGDEKQVTREATEVFPLERES